MEFKFTRTVDIDTTADFINKWHEDYPAFVPRTKELMWVILDAKDDIPLQYFFSPGSIQHMHRMFSAHTKLPWNERGEWRKVNVRIGNEIISPHFINVSMQELYEHVKLEWPFQDDASLKDWYIQFQRIHPFSDYNGRTAGIIMAAIAKRLFGYFLAPLQ